MIGYELNNTKKTQLLKCFPSMEVHCQLRVKSNQKSSKPGSLFCFFFYKFNKSNEFAHLWGNNDTHEYEKEANKVYCIKFYCMFWVKLSQIKNVKFFRDTFMFLILIRFALLFPKIVFYQYERLSSQDPPEIFSNCRILLSYKIVS